MIKFSEQVPSVYPNASRDFQYLCWLINIVLNSVKHNVDSLYDLPNSVADARLTELLAMTLGFKIKRNYDQKQLAALVAVLPRILKYKGTKTAVDIAGKALIAASGSAGGFNAEVKDCELKITLPEQLVDATLFMDLLPYILPAGMTCRIVKTNQVSKSRTTKLDYSEILIAKWIPDLDWDRTEQKSTGLSHLYEVPGAEPTVANYLNGNKDTPNIGLLDSGIIPMLINTLDNSNPEVDSVAPNRNE